MTRKRILSLFLSLVMCLSVLGGGMSVLAEDGFSYDKATDTLIVTLTGELQDYTEKNFNNRAWYNYVDSTKKVVFAPGVTHIGAYSFAKFVSLEEVVIPDTVTSIGSTAFGGNDNLKSIEIPNSVTEIGDYAFGYQYDMTIASDFVAYCGIDSAAQKYCLINYIPFETSIWDTASFKFPAGKPQCFWSYVPEEDGIIEFTSSCTSDTVGFIFDADTYVYTTSIDNESFIAKDDDSAGNVDFKVTANLQAGKRYYLSAKTKRILSYSPTVNVTVKFTPFDKTAYNAAVEEFVQLKSEVGKYSVSSMLDYIEAVEAAMKNSFSSQAQINNATDAIVSAKSLLKLNTINITFKVQDGDDITEISRDTYEYGESYILDAGADRVEKWTITNEANQTSLIPLTAQQINLIARESAEVVAFLTQEPAYAPTVRARYLAKNNAVCEVRYFDSVEDAYDASVDAPAVPFYTFLGWAELAQYKDENGVIEVVLKADYTYSTDSQNQCQIVGLKGALVNGGQTHTAYYDQLIILSGGESYAYADRQGNIISGINGTTIFAPHSKTTIYIVPVSSELEASTLITGSFITKQSDYGTLTINAQFFVPDGARMTDFGVLLSKSVKTDLEINKTGCTKVSSTLHGDTNEYSMSMNYSQPGTLYARPFLVYTASNGQTQVAYGTVQTIQLT